jgi:hypothetical protein
MPESAKRSIENIVQAAVTALGLRYGPVHAEVRGEDEDMKLIEIASRSIGGYCSKVLRFRDGLSLEDVIVRHALRMNDGRVPLEGQAAGVMMLQAPTEGIFKAVRGVEAAEAIDGIDEFILSAWKGQKLSPLPEGFLYLGFLFARANTPKRVESALRAAYEKLEFVIDTA